MCCKCVFLSFYASSFAHPPCLRIQILHTRRRQCHYLVTHACILVCWLGLVSQHHHLRQYRCSRAGGTTRHFALLGSHGRVSVPSLSSVCMCTSDLPSASGRRAPEYSSYFACVVHCVVVWLLFDSCCCCFFCLLGSAFGALSALPLLPSPASLPSALGEVFWVAWAVSIRYIRRG